MTREEIAEKRRAATSLQAGVIEGDKHAAATLVKLMNEVLDEAWENTGKPFKLLHCDTCGEPLVHTPHKCKHVEKLDVSHVKVPLSER